MHVTDLNSEDYIVQATTTKEKDVDGNMKLSGEITYNKVNALFIKDIDRLWRITDHDDVEYMIITLRKQGKGDRLTVRFTAIPVFIDYMKTQSIMDSNGDHERYDGSLTAFNAATKIFNGTPFDFVLLDDFAAKEWENFGGGESKLESFMRFLERYEAEFNLIDSTVYFEKQIGRDTNNQYRHKLNASNIAQEVDASNQFTAIRGYGNYGETDGSTDYRDAKLKRDYVSGLAEFLGKRYAPPLMDGRVKDKPTMDKKLKDIIDKSLKVSVTADVNMLNKQGYPIDDSQAGDRVFLIDKRIDLNIEVRVASQSITTDWTGKVISATITFGNKGLGMRYQTNVNNAVSNITDVFEGRKQIPLSSLDKRVQEISKIINGNTDSVFQYNSNGVIGWNGDNSNYMTRYVGDAIGFSKDGGITYNTAMSAELGIVADFITTGTLRAIIVEAVEIYGSYIEGSTIVSKKNEDDYVEMKGSTLYSYGLHDRTWFGETGIDNVQIGFDNGQLRARNHTQEWSLFFNDYGISTFSDGDGTGYPGGNASGAIEFHSYRYSDGAFRGLTIMSYGRIGIESSNENGARIYLNPNGASVRVSDVNDNYYNIAAAGFNQSSRTTQKRDIKDLEDDALEIIKSLEIKEYKRLTNGKKTIYDQWQAGITVENAPHQFLADADSVDLYTYVNYIARAVQQISEKVGA